MSSTYFGLEDGTGRFQLEDSLDDWLIEDATLFAVGNNVILLYDIAGIVSSDIILLYDMTGVVAKNLQLLYDIAGTTATNMAHSQGVVTPPALDTEVTLFDKTDTNRLVHSGWVSLANMASGDTVIIRVYRYEPVSGAMELYRMKTVRHSELKADETENMLAAFFVPIPTQRYRVTLEQTSGTPRAFNWEYYKHP